MLFVSELSKKLFESPHLLWSSWWDIQGLFPIVLRRSLSRTNLRRKFCGISCRWVQLNSTRENQWLIAVGIWVEMRHMETAIFQLDIFADSRTRNRFEFPINVSHFRNWSHGNTPSWKQWPNIEIQVARGHPAANRNGMSGVYSEPGWKIWVGSARPCRSCWIAPSSQRGAIHLNNVDTIQRADLISDQSETES